MNEPFDIYKMFGRKNYVYCESAQTIDAALARIEKLAKHLPGTYLVNDRATGEELSIKANIKCEEKGYRPIRQR